LIIYVDVLFVVNFFITYLLLLLTKLISKGNTKTIRLLLASFIGGLYSLVILVKELNFLITIIGKFFVSVIIVLVAFKFKRLTVFIKTLFVFYISNIVILGGVIAIWMIFKPSGVLIRNDVVYFDISARVLLFSAFISYLIAVVVVKIYNRTVGNSEVYSLTLVKNGQEVHMYAFADTGNKLKEPFSNYPVIVADSSKIPFSAERIIPYSSVGGEGTLNAFRPDKVIISSGKKSIETDKVYVALSLVDSKDFSAILNPEILNI
jgi:stage II sporulation protein GA (sporulation sigma-E factor processing peptidase)